MRKLFLFLLAIGIVTSLLSFRTVDGPGMVEDRYHVDQLADVVDEAIVWAYDTQEERFGGMAVCPGTGVSCVIKLAPDNDGDPVWLVSLKQKGKKNVEIVY